MSRPSLPKPQLRLELQPEPPPDPRDPSVFGQLVACHGWPMPPMTLPPVKKEATKP